MTRKSIMTTQQHKQKFNSLKMKYQFSFIVLLSIFFASCKKDTVSQHLRDPKFPLLNSVEYSDDFGTKSNREQLTYSPIDSSLLKIQYNYTTSAGMQGDYSYRFEKNGSIITSQSYTSDGQPVSYSQTAFTLGAANVVNSSQYKTSDNITRVISYDYNTAGYLTKASIMEEGRLKYVREFYYNNNILDSCILFQYYNNLPKKVFLSVFQYDKAKLNTVGNYYMMQGLMIAGINASKIFGQEQKYALVKESDYKFDGLMMPYIYQEFIYTNMYDLSNLLKDRNATITVHPPGANKIVIKRNYKYSYK